MFLTNFIILLKPGDKYSNICLFAYLRLHLPSVSALACGLRPWGKYGHFGKIRRQIRNNPYFIIIIIINVIIVCLHQFAY